MTIHNKKTYLFLLSSLLSTSHIGAQASFADRHPFMGKILLGTMATAVLAAPVVTCIGIYKMLRYVMASETYYFHESQWRDSIEHFKNGESIVNIFQNFTYINTKNARTPLHYAENQLITAIDETDSYSSFLSRWNPELSDKFKKLYNELRAIFAKISEVRINHEYAVEEMYLARNTVHTQYYPVHTTSTTHMFITSPS